MKLFDIRYDVLTAGPGRRTEVYFGGCSKALSGHPCRGCFNTKLWSGETSRDVTPLELAAEVIRKTPDKRVSFCGGEPTDQLEGLIQTCRTLKAAGFHILVYSYHTYDDMLLDPAYAPLFETIDILVDGAYDDTRRIYATASTDWVRRSVGSANQQIIFFEGGDAIVTRPAAI